MRLTSIVSKYIQKQQAVKKGVAPKCQGEKRCEIKGGGQEMAVIIV